MRHVEEIAVFYPKQPEYNPQMTKGKPLHHAKGESKAKRNQNLNYGKTQDGYFNEERKHSDMKYPQQLIVENALLKFQKPKSARNKPLNHPTEKPVELMAYLIETYSSEGDIILDLTMGSGTTGVAAAQTNRKFIGIEMNSEIFNVAKRRIEEAYASNHEKRNNYEQN